jgi:hypothetical protein
VVNEVLGDEGELGEVAEDRLEIEGGRPGCLRSALSGGRRFGEEAQAWAVLEEVALVQPDRWWLVRKRAVLQRGGTTLCGNCEQGCKKEESRVGFSGSSSVRIRRSSCGGGEAGQPPLGELPTKLSR